MSVRERKMRIEPLCNPIISLAKDAAKSSLPGCGGLR
jgi:hypothetical protein